MEDLKEKTIEECEVNIQNFADKHQLQFEKEGECGFGRECVGLLWRDNYVDFNPNDAMTYEPIAEFFDERLYDIAPSDAYHKHDCLAVLGRGEEAIRQLSDWVDRLTNLNATIEKFATNATGVQALVSGTHKMAVKLPK